MEVKQTLIEFLENELPSYSNPAGVQLYLNPDSSLFLFADYPGIELPPHIKLELMQEFKSVKDFLAMLGLCRLQQLLKLTPADLLASYRSGKINIVCSLEGRTDREMSFRKHNGILWARDIHNKAQQLKIPIRQPEDFIAYTVAHYQDYRLLENPGAVNEDRLALLAFLKRQQMRYRNPAGVIFYRIADGSFYVAARYPGIEYTMDISLEFFEHFDHLAQFMTLFHFSDPERLADVKPEDLLQLYEGELLDIVCTLKGRKPREMSFRKIGGLIWASNTKKKMHQVILPGGKPEEFIAYTRKYYKIVDN